MVCRRITDEKGEEAISILYSKCEKSVNSSKRNIMTTLNSLFEHSNVHKEERIKGYRNENK